MAASVKCNSKPTPKKKKKHENRQAISILIILSTICSICACSTLQNPYKDWNSLIDGKWVLTTKYDINYPLIEFTKEGAVFHSFADTIYRFSYKIKENNLILNDGNKVTQNNIVKLTTDSLILETLVEKTERQIYVRENK